MATGCTGNASSDEEETSPTTGEQADEDGSENRPEDRVTEGPAAGLPNPGIPFDRQDGPGPTLSEAEAAERVSELGGQLAIGNGPELVIVRPDGGSPLVLDGSESIVASQPTWSRDGTRLAWSSVAADRQAVLVQDFNDEGLPDGDPLDGDASGPPVFYLQWSVDDDRLAYLRDAPEGGAVETGTLEPGASLEPQGQAAPLFVSWAPVADRLLAHVGDGTLGLLDQTKEPSGLRPLTTGGGGFSAPAWVDERTALVVLDGGLTLLDVETGDQRRVLELPPPVQFVLSPDRQRVAVQTAGDRIIEASARTDLVDRSALVVIDLATGEQTVVTTERAVAWEWSPDSDKLAWLGLGTGAIQPAARWHFWSRSGSPVAPNSVDFLIPRKVGQAYLPFFAQYAQSVTGWSPDSSAFAFAGSVQELDGFATGVWIQLVDETAPPLRISPGDFVTWGSGQTPPPSAGGSSAA